MAEPSQEPSQLEPFYLDPPAFLGKLKDRQKERKPNDESQKERPRETLKLTEEGYIAKESWPWIFCVVTPKPPSLKQRLAGLGDWLVKTFS